MAEPKMDPHLKILLDYQFYNPENPNLRLGVYKDPSQQKHLCLYNKKTGNLVYQDLDDNYTERINLTLKKIAKYVEGQQEQWLEQYPQYKVRLETQLAWLKRKVTERNLNKKTVKNIHFKNLAEWKLNIKIQFPESPEKNASEIITKSVTKSYTYDRLTTLEEIYQKCQKAWRSPYYVHITCREKYCPLRNEPHDGVGMIPNDLFSQMTIESRHLNQGKLQDLYYARGYFISSDENGRNHKIIVKASLLDAAKLERNIEWYHDQVIRSRNAHHPH